MFKLGDFVRIHSDCDGYVKHGTKGYVTEANKNSPYIRITFLESVKIRNNDGDEEVLASYIFEEDEIEYAVKSWKEKICQNSK